MVCQSINWVGDATMCAPMNLKSPRVSVPWHQPIPKIDLLLNQRHQHYFNSSTPMPDNHSRDYKSVPTQDQKTKVISEEEARATFERIDETFGHLSHGNFFKRFHLLSPFPSTVFYCLF